MRLLTFTVLSLSTALVAGHARISKPPPLDAPPENPSGNAYNAPLAPNGSEFPCKNLHTKVGVDKTPTASWQAGSIGLFEILGHVTAGEGALAAHSGGSCQASLSFDNGQSFHVLHTYHGGCPRDVPFNSNIAGPNQTFTFAVPPETKSGPALFSWTWTAATGNRDEFYMNCASVEITGDGTSTLDDYPDMYVGDMDLPGQIAEGECRSIAGTAMLYPNPGPAERITVTTVAGLPFKGPTGGNCFAPGGKPAQGSSSSSSSVVSSSSGVAGSSAAGSSAAGSSAAVSTPPAIPTTPGSAYIAPTTLGSVYIAPTSAPGAVYIATTTPDSAYIAPTSAPDAVYVAPTSAPSAVYVAPTTAITAIPEPSDISTPDESDIPTDDDSEILTDDDSEIPTDDDSDISAPEESDVPTAEESDLPYIAPAPSANPSHPHYRHTHNRHGHHRTITTTYCPSSTLSPSPSPSASSVYSVWKQRRHRAV